MHIIARMTLQMHRAGNTDIAAQLWDIAIQILRQEAAQ